MPQLISVSYGVCESTVSAGTASRTVAERRLAAATAGKGGGSSTFSERRTGSELATGLGTPQAATLPSLLGSR